MVSDQRGMLAQPVGVALNRDDHRVMQQAIKQRGVEHGIAGDVGPLAEAEVVGHDHGAALAAGVDQLEEQVAAARAHRQVADLVDDQQAAAAEQLHALAQLAFALGLAHGVDEFGQAHAAGP